jgi:hypothetical protein
MNHLATGATAAALGLAACVPRTSIWSTDGIVDLEAGAGIR